MNVEQLTTRALLELYEAVQSNNPDQLCGAMIEADHILRAFHKAPVRKSFTVNTAIGRTKYSVSYHDGEKQHEDGSPFYDLRTFRNSRDRDAFVRELKQQGYIPY